MAKAKKQAKKSARKAEKKKRKNGRDGVHVMSAGEKEELLELERAFWDAMKDRDGKTAERLTGDACIVIGPQGIGEIGPEAIGGMVENAPYEIEEYGMKDDVHFRMVDDGVAVVAYEVDERLGIDGESTRIKAYDSTVWVKKGGHWVAALHTETIAGDPYGRDRRRASDNGDDERMRAM